MRPGSEPGVLSQPDPAPASQFPGTYARGPGIPAAKGLYRGLAARPGVPGVDRPARTTAEVARVTVEARSGLKRLEIGLGDAFARRRNHRPICVHV